MKELGILLFALLTISGSCQSGNRFLIRIEANTTGYDTLFLRELITERILAKVPLNKWKTDYAFTIDAITPGVLTVAGSDTEYLTLIRPGVRKAIRVDSGAIRTLNAIPDSLINFLFKSTNQMFSQHGNVIFAQDNPAKVKSLFDSLVQTRQEQLIKFKPRLTEEEYGLLDYQNKARAYSFLMFYGRIVKRYEPDDDFFAFISKIDNETIFSKSLPQNVLYKYEIMLLKQKGTIDSINDFLAFIETQTTNKDLEAFFKAIYLNDVIESPSYWKRHEQLFTATTIRDALRRESANPYGYLIQKSSESFYASQRGVKGYDFTASGLDGTTIRLSDFRNKVVVIDTWATWCGPCVQQRPAMIELAKAYQDVPDVVFLMVSVDKDVERWKKYALQTNNHQYGMDVIIPDGMNGEFGNKYLVKAIPKYILIDKDGIIIDPNLSEPSLNMKQRIERAEKKSQPATAK
jgi:thiol-disulfide isomerase/thioredoxin